MLKLLWIIKPQNGEFKFKNEFSNKQSQILLKDKSYSYYSIGVSLHSDSSYTNLTDFISKLEDYLPDLFYNVSIKYSISHHQSVQNFLELYLSK